MAKRTEREKEQRRKQRRTDPAHWVGAVRWALRGLTRAITMNEAADIEPQVEYLFRGGLEREIEELRAGIVASWREAGMTDSQVAALLGVTRQAVEKRWRAGVKKRGSGGRYH